MNCLVRLAQDDDADQASSVIQRAPRETNARDYSAENIEKIVGNFTPSAVRALIANHTAFFVAVMGVRIVGTAFLNGNSVETPMVSPDLQRRGVGRLLMRSIEGVARDRGVSRLSLWSSITAEAFYDKLGYIAIRDHFRGNERTIIMERSLD
jgi:GNAT superfamily N-acetyltransferase